MIPANEAQNCYSIRVHVPEGTMFVIIAEDKYEKINWISISIGKSGSIFSAWADATSRLATLALKRGASIAELIEEVSGITSDKISLPRRLQSGPEGFAYALMRYAKEKEPKRRKRVAI